MKRTLKLVLSLFIISMIMSCGGDEDTISIEDYISQNNLTTQVTNSGLHYIIQNPGTQPSPSLSSTVTVNYRGYFLTGGDFDSNDNFTFPVSNFIQGWQEGLQLIGTGGSITLIIPANLAYGNRGAGSIPPNTPIGFEIDLISFE